MAIDVETGFQTDIQVEWLMDDKCQKFNVGTALINRVNQFQRSLTDIPTGEEFNTASNSKQEQVDNNPAKVKIYFTLYSHLKFNTTKYDIMVYNYLRHHNVYLEPDHFKWNDTVSPGIVIDLHPDLIHTEDYKTEIAKSVLKFSTLDSKIVHQWKEKPI
eukprot:7762736-Ditylum_brightwellii.AAC.1